MKSTDTLSEDAQLLKGAISTCLAHHGHTLSELEDSFANQDSEKSASLMKLAVGPLDMLKVLGLGGNIAQIGAGSAALAGGVGAAGIYGAYRGLSDSQRKIDEAESVKQRINLARRELEASRAGLQ